MYRGLPRPLDEPHLAKKSRPTRYAAIGEPRGWLAVNHEAVDRGRIVAVDEHDPHILDYRFWLRLTDETAVRFPLG
jgi:hypothetical protein